MLVIGCSLSESQYGTWYNNNRALRYEPRYNVYSNEYGYNIRPMERSSWTPTRPVYRNYVVSPVEYDRSYVNPMSSNVNFVHRPRRITVVRPRYMRPRFISTQPLRPVFATPFVNTTTTMVTTTTTEAPLANNLTSTAPLSATPVSEAATLSSSTVQPTTTTTTTTTTSAEALQSTPTTTTLGPRSEPLTTPVLEATSLSPTVTTVAPTSEAISSTETVVSSEPVLSSSSSESLENES